jgi:hypothetical protein
MRGPTLNRLGSSAAVPKQWYGELMMSPQYPRESMVRPLSAQSRSLNSLVVPRAYPTSVRLGAGYVASRTG